MNRLSAVLFAICLLAGAASAQITIEAADVPQAIGDSFFFKYTAHDATVDNGAPGGPQTWTFDTSTYVGYVVGSAIVDRAATPFGSVFPDANITIHQALGPYEYWVYRQIDPDAMLDLGMAMANADTAVAHRYSPAGVNLDLPLALGTAWQTTFGYADTTSDSTSTEYANHYYCRVDAWGTAVAPTGSFACLRLNVIQFEVTSNYLRGALVSCDTVLTRRFHWGTKEQGTVAMTHSMDGDTSLTFTQADDYMVIVFTNAGGVAEAARPAVGRIAVRPNPCRRAAVVELAGVPPGPATLVIADVTGRVVARQATAGRRPVALDLCDVPAGAYVLTVSAAGTVVSQPVVRLP